MAVKQGYRVYFDKETKKFRYDKEISEMRFCGKNSTTSWFADLKSAMNAAQSRNQYSLGDVIVCKDCGEAFWITEDERNWYAEKGLTLPTRCESCRRKKKNERTSH